MYSMSQWLRCQGANDVAIWATCSYLAGLWQGPGPERFYEEAANLMIRRISGDILSKFKDARHQRRRAAKDLEDEFAKREADVRGKTTVLDKDVSS